KSSAIPFTKSVTGCSTNEVIARAIRSRRSFIFRLVPNEIRRHRDAAFSGELRGTPVKRSVSYTFFHGLDAGLGRGRRSFRPTDSAPGRPHRPRTRSVRGARSWRGPECRRPEWPRCPRHARRRSRKGPQGPAWEDQGRLVEEAVELVVGPQERRDPLPQ